MIRVLLISVRFHDGRYHGAGDWPPSPARLFQALVAGTGQGGPLDLQRSEPLEWLEELDPPVIAAPGMIEGQRVDNYVPNNDLDAVGGNVRKIGSIRTPKVWKPKLFDKEIPLHYAWTFEDDERTNGLADRVCQYAEKLYQLGRGVDQAWACGEIIGLEDLEARLADSRGIIYRPTGGNGRILACPQPGSLESLKERYAAMSQRFGFERMSDSAKLRYTKPPRPRFSPQAYDSPPARQLFELREEGSEAPFATWPLAKSYQLVVFLRDAAVARLKAAMPESEGQIEKCLMGRKPNGDDEAPKSARVRILPLPSIGHHQADRSIRRVLVEVSAGCLLRADDVFWSFSGLELPGAILIPSADETMLSHYGVGSRDASVWRTVTPAALPESARRRRIDPSRGASEFKGGNERASEQAGAAKSVLQALRHAEIDIRTSEIRLQREPFDVNGDRVEVFAPGTRFAKERLWHVEITFMEPISGPLAIGDGRFLGLGIMAPIARGRNSR